MSVETMISAEQIHDRIQIMGREIRESIGDGPILCIGVLKGSFIFMADLVRAIPGDVRCDFLGVSSYEGTESTGVVRITHDLKTEISGQHVLVVEDIVDTGLTLDFLQRSLSVRHPKSLTVASLLDKPSRRVNKVQVDHIGFTIPDEFVVGYGLDLDEQFRNLPFVGIYSPE